MFCQPCSFLDDQKRRIFQVVRVATLSTGDYSFRMDSVSSAVAGSVPYPIVEEEPLEIAYGRVADEGRRKKYGQWFTPPELAEIMLDWVFQIGPKTLLDPALGTGILTRRALAREPQLRVSAYEIDRLIAEYSGLTSDCRVDVHTRDFLLSDVSPVDAVVMNPPYIRHREIRDKWPVQKVSAECGVYIPRSANLYVPFVIKACLSLRPGGRAAILVPSEWMSANFSTSLKAFLLDGFLNEILYFSHASTIFHDALTTASVLMIERDR
jgi:type I restriction-modification system DNA methylase subunit